MSRKKDTQPIVELDFYPKRLVARVREINLSYRIVVVLIGVILVLLVGVSPDQIIVLINTLADILK